MDIHQPRNGYCSIMQSAVTAWRARFDAESVDDGKEPCLQ